MPSLAAYDPPEPQTTTHPHAPLESQLLRILHVEDCPDDHHLLVRSLNRNGLHCRAHCVRSRSELDRALDPAFYPDPWHAVLCDHNLPGLSSIDALETIRKKGLDLPFIIVSGAISELTVLAAMKAGAHDYIPKNSSFRLIPALQREIHEAEVRRQKKIADLQLHRTNNELQKANHRLKEAVETLTKTQNHLAQTGRLRELGQVASGVAHDFNNALTKILGITELLIHRCPDERDTLDGLRTVTLDSAKVISRLRDFYRPHQPSSPDSLIDLNDTVTQAVDLTTPKWKTQSEIARRQVSIDLKLGDVHPAVGDASEVREALTNLIFNACDAMPDGGSITFTTRQDGTTAVFEISDTGTGMSPDTLSRCREPFFSTKGHSGTGLGLSLVDSVMKRFGGELLVSSTAGTGTTVTLRFATRLPSLPASDTPTNQAPMPLGAPPKSLDVLVVDDDPTIAEILKRFLLLDGHSVTVASNGLDALKRFAKKPHDLVITDRAMPVMNGDEFSQDIKNLSPATPVIMVTGYLDLSDKVHHPNPSVDRLLTKPVDRDALRRAVGALCPASPKTRHTTPTTGHPTAVE